MFWTVNNYFLIDSLIQRNDTLFYYSNLSTTPFFFLPNAGVGQNWTIYSDNINNDYDQITITCSDIHVETFFGITDSVKTFTMTPNGTSLNQIPVNNFEIKLSKNHGLINFVPFILFLFHPFFVDFTSSQLIGLDSLETWYGYRQPRFTDYFHLSAGDILLWEHHYIPVTVMDPPWSEFYRDSITNVISNTDSVVYTYNRTKKDTDNVISQFAGLTETFSKSEFEKIIMAPPNWVGFGNNRYGQSLSTNTVLYWSTSFLKLNIDSISGDTITSFTFNSDAPEVDTTTCQINLASDLFYTFSIDTRAGITKYCHSNFDSDCTTLIGSKINGNQIGDITLSVNELYLSKINTLQIYPNPVNDILIISNYQKNKKSDYQIYNNVGQLIKHESLQRSEIAVYNLKSGIYFIRIKTENEIKWGKFVKK